MTSHPRRHFLAALAAAGGAAALPVPEPLMSPLLLPPRLKAGDTLALVSPSNATALRAQFELAIASLRALGFQVREGAHLRSRYGAYGGTDAERAADLNAMFADPGIQGIVAMTGGSGATRLLDRLDYALIRRNPKVLLGFSDITALLNAITARSGLVTFHGPVAASEWNPFTVHALREVLMNGAASELRNPPPSGDNLVPAAFRTRTIHGGVARGPLIGGNLSVLVTLLGTPYQPDFRGAILFLEDLNEEIYRIDRMLAHLRLSGALNQVAGVVLGQFTDCEPGNGYGSLTLEQVWDEYVGALGIPVFSGSVIGHVAPKLTLPVGLPVELDADRATIRLLRPAVI
jgi:muramoyltetrapeptide carboxypeptidase